MLFRLVCSLLLALLPLSCALPLERNGPRRVRILSFNILQGGGDASNVGFLDENYGGSRLSYIARVVREVDADIVGVQEDTDGTKLLAALGTGWLRVGNIYSRLPLSPLAAHGTVHMARVHVTREKSVVVANVHWRPYPYGPYDAQEWIRENGAPDEGFVERILAGADKHGGERGYEETLTALAPHLAAEESIVVTGDFNEPSHLDWTAGYAEQGADRWVENPTQVPLRIEVPWTGSQLLAEAGFVDLYRAVHPDPAARPGNTWTPPYEAHEGRRPYADQVLDRIDMVYATPDLVPLDASTVGESRETSDVVFSLRWPSDHRAVLVEFGVPEPAD